MLKTDFNGPNTYDGYREWMGEKSSKKLAHNTWCHKVKAWGSEEVEFQIVYHSTTILTFRPEHVKYHNGGWATRTTRDRLNQFGMDGVKVTQKGFTEYIQTPNLDNPVPFYGRVWVYSDYNINKESA